jgi:hypothetical protein
MMPQMSWTMVALLTPAWSATCWMTALANRLEAPCKHGLC